MESSARELVDSQALARHFGVGIETVRNWVRDGRVPCIRPTRKTVRFDLAEVERAVRVNSIPALEAVTELPT